MFASHACTCVWVQFSTIGPGIAFGFGYWLLHKHLHSYTTFWAVMLGLDCLICIFQLLIMPETMPTELRRGQFSVADLNPIRYYFRK